MPPSRPAAPALYPEEFLRRACEAPDAATRRREAEAGLKLEDVELDTRVLLLRQRYLAEMADRTYRQAAETAATMASLGPLADIAYHDRCRALQALGEVREALGAQRLAARNAPARRRSFHYWSLATLQHFSGDVDGALASLCKGLRHAHADRPLLEGHEAYVLLDSGTIPEDLDAIRSRLRSARCGEGYGQFVLGMIAHQVGDAPGAITHLRAFLRRNASADEVKVATLREELRRARMALSAHDTESV